MLNAVNFKKPDKRPYRQRIATTFLVTFICLLMLVVLTGIILCSVVMNTLLSNESYKNRSMLRQAVLTLDNSMENIDKYMNNIMLSDEMASICSKADPYTNPSTVIESMKFKEYLSKVNSIDGLVSDFIIYLKASNMLFVGNSQNFFDPMAYFRNFMTMVDGTTEETMQLFTQRYRNLNVTSAMLNIYGYNPLEPEISGQCLMYIKPIIINGSYMGNMIAVMPAAHFSKVLIDNAFNGEGEKVWIEDTAGNVMISLPDEYKDAPSEEGMVACDIDSSRLALKYRLLTPIANAYNQIMPTLVNVVLTVVLIFIAGIIVSIWLSIRFGKPLDNISVNLHTLLLPYSAAPSGGVKELKFLDNTVQVLLEEQRRTAAYLSTQTSIVKRLFYEKLLNGYFLDNEQIISMLGQIGEAAYNAPMELMVCKIYSSDNEISLAGSALVKGVIDDVMSGTIEGRVTSLDIALDTYVLLTSSTEHDCAAKEILDKCALALNSKLAQNPALSCAIVVSQPICQYIDIGSSYSRCLDSICPPSYGESCSYISVEDVPVHNMCAVSLDDEARMINFLLSGSHINAGNMLRSIFTEHFGTEKSITAEDRLFITQFYFLLMRLKDRINDESFKPVFGAISELPHRISGLHTSEEAFNVINDIFCEWCGIVQSNSVPKTQKLMQEVKAYIDKKYSDTELSLQTLAEHFALSDAYLSRAFKECWDVNIMSYLEQVRINNALLLMKEEMTFDAMAHRVGFENTYRFRNAFKRVTGILPSQYRNNLTEE